MGKISSIMQALESAGKAIKEPIGLPAKRGTAAHPTLLKAAQEAGPPITQRAPEVPFHGRHETRTIVRTTAEKEPRTLAGSITGVKESLKALVEPFPTVSKDISEKLYRGAWRKEASAPVADLDVAQWFRPLQKAPVEQAALVHDFMITTDEVAQAMRGGHDKIKDIPLDVWQQSAQQLQTKVEADPEVAATVKNVRAGLDEMFNDMVGRGWIDPKRYLGDYTPIRRLNAMLDGLAEFTGEDPTALKSRLLSSQQKRGGPIGTRETDVLDLLRRTRTEYLEKVAQHEAFVELLADPTINFTDAYVGKDMVDKGLRVYRTGPGMFGATAKSKEGYLLDSHLRAIDPKGKLTPGGYVFPEKVVQALETFNRRHLSGEEGKWAKASSTLAKWLTVYNPANTQINRGSDLLVAMFLPEEGTSHPIGVLKWYGEATKASYGRAFGDKAHYVTLHGKTVDISDLAVREGLTTGTIQHEVGGEMAPLELMRLTPEGQQMHNQWLGHIGKTMEADRLATEMAPRIASGLEAVERTGDWSQFGKVGRDITFRYGAGAPAASRFPIARAMAPFMQFQGLATQRMLAMAGAKGMAPKARLALGVVAVPMAIHAWNTQNDDYKNAELSLLDFERNQMHVFMPDPANPAKVKRAIDGSPVALRMRLWVPDQVAGFVGFGNFAPRASRVLEGRDTPMQFAKDSIKQGTENVSSMLVVPSLVREVVSGRTSTGKELTLTERLERPLPAIRAAHDVVQTGINYGVGEASAKFMQEITGMKPAISAHAGTTLLDAQLKEAQRKLAVARREKAIYAKNGPPHKLKASLKKIDAAAEELRRIAKMRKKLNPPKGEKPSQEGVQSVREKNREAVTEWRSERKEK